MSKKSGDETEEPGFRFTDRRRRSPEAPQEPAHVPESPPERTPELSATAGPESPPTDTEKQEQEFVLLPVADLLRIFIAELHTRALMHMGLIPNPATRLVAKDLAQARLAIDSAAALIEQISSVLAPAEREELQHMLANLRLTFVRQSGGERGAS